jgi:cytochrome c553
MCASGCASSFWWPSAPGKSLFAVVAWLCACATGNARGADAADFEKRYAESVRPLLETYCSACHGKEQEAANKLDLSLYASIDDVGKAHARWQKAIKRLEAKEMPPDDAAAQPSEEERRAIIDFLKAFFAEQAKKNAGDPGPVVARRLNNAEYDYTIRDLTGVDIRPAQEFPVDPANEAGFDNSGESLAMSGALVKKYLQAARQVSEYVVFKPEGFCFAPHPVVTDTDRDKYCVKRIVDFYKRQPTNYADYFQAAWRYKNREGLGKPGATLDDFAAAGRVSPKYLQLMWATLTETKDEVGPIAQLQVMWNDLPAAEGSKIAADGREPEVVRGHCEKMRDYVVRLREKLEWKFANLVLKPIGPGSQPFVLWKDRQFATHRMTLNRSALQVAGETELAAADEKPDAEAEAGADDDDAAKKKMTLKKPVADPELTIPADPAGRARYEDAFERFCKVFPDAFYISERGRIFLDRPKDKQDKGRLLNAGFHSMMGYFRDDEPLCELMLDDAGQRELDAMWEELDFITLAPIRQHTGFIWYERAESHTIRGSEFDQFRSEDKDITSEAKIKQFAEVYLAQARKNAPEDGNAAEAIKAVEDFFDSVNAKLRWLEQAKLASEPSHIKSLLEFAQRDYRRPLSDAERDDLVAFYRQLKDKDGLSHEDAMRDTVASVLMSPHFCYRLDLEVAGPRQKALGDYGLASRLSYFIWSSMPDAELLECARKGELHKPEVMTAQARRMLRDERARGLAVEFLGNWLDFRRFEEHNAVDRERFPAFNNELRQAMFEEPIQFFLNMVRDGRPVLDLLYADYTFVNPALAKHYGMTGVTGAADHWQRVDDAGQYERGGLLPMAVFLTKNAPGLRTSPVKRGYWVVRRLLGEEIPPPPPNVPVLPTDEAQLGDLTLRETLARHREIKSCAACHDRFDSMGLVFEGYGPIGERRDKDLGGKPVDANATFPGGSEGEGLAGLRQYIKQHREADFLDNLCRKLLSYGLSRTLVASDEPLVEAMRKRLAQDDYRFNCVVESIVTSPQFLMKRDEEKLTSSDNFHSGGSLRSTPATR